MPCLNDDTLLGFLSGRLSAERRQAVEEHAAQCAECRWIISMAGAGAGGDTRTTLLSPDASSRRSTGFTPLEAGTVVNATYRIERLIGRGGMGTVYAATHLHLQRRVAIKFLAESLHTSDEAIARLRREAEVTSQLEHPNIVEVLDFNYTEAGVPFLVMELLEGESLHGRLQRQAAVSDLAEFGSIVRQTVSALQAAHDKGVVHRDLKPTNIFLCRREARDDFVKVVDFGISKLLSAKTELTSLQAVLGSPAYMTPEQACGRSADVDERSDVFALGAIMFRMLAGEEPFRGDSVPSTLYSVVHADPVENRRWDELPRSIRRVVLRALSKRPQDRQPSMAALGEEIDQALHLVAPRRTRRWLLPALAAALVVSASSVGLFWHQARRTDRSTARSTRDGAALHPDTRPRADLHPDTGPRADLRPALAAEAGPPPASTPAVRLPAAVHARRRPARLTIESRAGAAGPLVWGEVFLDGKPVGRTPLTLPRVAAGVHIVEVRRAGYQPARQRVVVRSGHRTAVSLALRPAK